MPDDLDNNEDEPLSPEQEAEMQARMKEAEAAWEVKATQVYGPPEVRTRKNQRYAARLVRRYTEPVIRGLLTALSRLDEPSCAQRLSEMDLLATSLDEIIQPFELYGTHFSVHLVKGNDYTVEIYAGYGTTGSGGRFVVTQHGNEFLVTDELRQWIN